VEARLDRGKDQDADPANEVEDRAPLCEGSGDHPVGPPVGDVPKRMLTGKLKTAQQDAPVHCCAT
jgi:hypothetical protein